jgi:hypothetical protein
LVLLSLSPYLIWAAPADGKKSLKTLVAVGDSLAAGFQNFSLLDPQQIHSFPFVIAHQANTNMNLPLVPCPGIPNVLQLVGPFTFPPVIQPIGGAVTFPRENPTVQATNLAVPGQTVSDALRKVPSPPTPTTSAVDFLTFVVLGFPAALQPNPVFRSQVDTAVAMQPTTAIVWLGANDALFALLFGDFSQFTPLPNFIGSYTGVLQNMARTRANLFTANIPDITLAPFFTPAPVASALFQIPLGTGPLTNVGPFDFLRPGALAVVAAQLATNNMAAIPISANCPISIPGLPVNLAPCFLTAGQAATARLVIDTFNAVIAVESHIFGATMVDVHALVNRLHTNGYRLGNGQQLSLSFLGGLASLDGVHPTNTFHAILANQFIDAMNGELHTSIPHASVDQVALDDPLISPFAASTKHVCQ